MLRFSRTAKSLWRGKPAICWRHSDRRKPWQVICARLENWSPPRFQRGPKDEPSIRRWEMRDRISMPPLRSSDCWPFSRSDGDRRLDAGMCLVVFQGEILVVEFENILHRWIEFHHWQGIRLARQLQFGLLDM